MLISLFSISIFAAPALAEIVTKKEAEQAINKVLVENGVDKKIKLFDVLGCLPAFKKTDAWNCILDFENFQTNERTTQGNVFHRQNNIWIVDPEPSDSGTCAPKEFAESVLRKARNDASLKVTEMQDDGEGLLTEDRGISRDKKGPLRLMCIYDVKLGSGEERSFITYQWHDGKSYIIDPDWEIWD